MGYFKSEESEKRYQDAKKVAGKTLHIKAKFKYSKKPKKCKHCEEIIPYEKRNNIFCNASCSASFNNKGVPRGIKPKDLCLNCKKEVKRSPNKFCDNRCQNNQQYKIYIDKWKQGLVDGIVGKSKTSGHIKRYFREKYNNACQECGWSKVNIHTETVPVELHHVDSNYKNNLEENLELFCPNCHSLTHNYGSRGGTGCANNRRSHR